MRKNIFWSHIKIEQESNKIQNKIAKYQKWTVRAAVLLSIVSLIIGAGQIFLGYKLNYFVQRQDNLVQLQKEQLELTRLHELTPHVRNLGAQSIGLQITELEDEPAIFFRDPFYNFSSYYVITELMELIIYECRDFGRVRIFGANVVEGSQIYHDLGRDDPAVCEGKHDFWSYDFLQGVNIYDKNLTIESSQIGPHSRSINSWTVVIPSLRLSFPTLVELNYSAQLDRRHFPVDGCVVLPVVNITRNFYFDAEGNLEPEGHSRCR